MEDKKTKKRTFIGTVIKDCKDKTISVLVTSEKLHPKYKKFYKSSKKYQVHDEKGQAKAEDKVKFVECRPLSKRKRWRMLEILTK